MTRRVVALAGGVGGAKMAQGLLHAYDDVELTVVVNTADDFEIYGLWVSPDLDTVMYTLGEIANPATGWGIAGDTRNTLDGIAAYGVGTWFLVGDRDFATDMLRTSWLREGQTLAEVTARLAAGLGISARIVPMTNDPVATMVETPAGELAFQDYFVRRRQQDKVIGVRFAGIEDARATAEAVDAIERADLVVFCPSNPIVSIGPLLAVDTLRAAVEASRAPRVAVSPIIAGKALKGPADKMLTSLGHKPSALGVAKILSSYIDGFVIDRQDSDLIPEIEALGLQVRAMETIMGGKDDRARLGREVIDFGWSLRSESRSSMSAPASIVVPIRSLSDGKTRLSPVLDPAARAALTREMLDRVVRAALGTASRAGVVVISPDPVALAAVGRIDSSIRLIAQFPERPGLNPALDQAAAEVRAAGGSTVLILPADLPLVSSGDIDNLLRRDAPVVIAPDRHGMGTNALMVRLDAFGVPFQFQFGEGSYGKHQDEAHRLGVDAVTAVALGTSFDLDTPNDLAELDVLRVRQGAERAPR